jgi:hypothetical protein
MNPKKLKAIIMTVSDSVKKATSVTTKPTTASKKQ